jgi:hypothetical protein
MRRFEKPSRLTIPAALLLAIGAGALVQNERSQDSDNESHLTHQTVDRIIVEFENPTGTGNPEIQTTNYYDDGTAYRYYETYHGYTGRARLYCDDGQLVTERFGGSGNYLGTDTEPHVVCEDDNHLVSLEDSLIEPLY